MRRDSVPEGNGMGAIDIQHVCAVIAFLAVGLWAFSIAWGTSWVQIRGAMFTVAAMCFLWVVYLSTAVVPGSHPLNAALWSLFAIQIVTATGLALVAHFTRSLDETQNRVIASLRSRGEHNG